MPQTCRGPSRNLKDSRLLLRFRFLPVVACAVALAGAADASAAALYPDMKTLPPRDLRFSNTAWNDGEGPLMIGNNVPAGATSVAAIQTVQNDTGGSQTFNAGSY